jgi:shikimate kinase
MFGLRLLRRLRIAYINEGFEKGVVISRRGIALGGFMGTGKSTVGSLLAADLGLPFRDLDDELEQAFGTISHQFSDAGEAVFRQRESDLLRVISVDVPCVLATGGGAWISEQNQRVLRERFRRIVLTAPLSLIQERLGDDKRRPLWNDEVATLFHSRASAYERADLVVDSTEMSVNEVVREIVQWLRSQ